MISQHVKSESTSSLPVLPLLTTTYEQFSIPAILNSLEFSYSKHLLLFDFMRLFFLPRWPSPSHPHCPRSGVPNLWDLMPEDLRWSRCNSNKAHNKCKALESSRKHVSFPIPHPRKTCLPWNQSLVPKGLGAAVLDNSHLSFKLLLRSCLAPSKIFFKFAPLSIYYNE